MKYKAFAESEKTMITIAEFLNSQLSKKELDNTKLKVLFMQILKVSCTWLFCLHYTFQHFIIYLLVTYV
jgi:hypothetical protein